MKRFARLVLLAFVALTPAGNAFSEGVAGTLEYSLSGTAIPRHRLIEAFFAIADSLCQASEEDRQYLVQEVGLIPDTESEAILMRALERARELRYGKDGPDTRAVSAIGPNEIKVVERGKPEGPAPRQGESMDQYLARRDDRSIQRARELANIYYDLARELKEQGFSLIGIENYIDSHIAPGSALSSDEPLDSPLPDEIAFEDQMRVRAKTI
jgi:hypothetical protein